MTHNLNYDYYVQNSRILDDNEEEEER